MLSAVVRLAVGCALILFGRWAYRNPMKIHGGAFLTSRGFSLAYWVARVWSFLVIFGGAYTALIVVTAHISEDLLGVLLALVLSAVLAWYLRPKLRQATQPVRRAEEPRSVLTATGRRFAWVVLVAGAAMAVTNVAIVLLRMDLTVPILAEAFLIPSLILVMLYRGRREG